MKSKRSSDAPNILELSQTEAERVKNALMQDGMLVKCARIKGYDAKFSQTVLSSVVALKLYLYAGFALYAALNLFGLIASVVYKTYNLVTIIAQPMVCVIVLFVCVAIFKNINTNKKTEKETLYIVDGGFMFNYNNGVVATPDLYYCLAFENLRKIEFEIYGSKKGQVYGKATFTFGVYGYQVTHVVNAANLTEIEDCLSNLCPSALDVLVVDGCSRKLGSPSSRGNVKVYLYSACCLAASVLITVVPLALNYRNLSLIIAGVLLALTAVVVFASRFLYTQGFAQGAVLGCVFILVGYCVPLFIMLRGGKPFMTCIASNSLLLLVTFFGNIGLSIYLSVITVNLNKLSYLIKNSNSRRI